MRKPGRAPRDSDGDGVVFDPHAFAGLFAPPRWLRDLGASAWLIVGVTLALVAAVWVISLTATIVMPLVTAAVVAAVASPVVRALADRGVTRGLGAALVLIVLMLVAVGLVVLVLGGVGSQVDALRSALHSARDTITGWLADAGISRDSATTAGDDVSKAVSSALPALLDGLAAGIKRLSSLAVFLGLTFLSLFFLLKDGPLIRHWAERHMRVPPDVAHGMTQRVLESLRRYFAGVTAVAVFNAAVVAVGALLLGVPLPGTIALVTFLGAYVPYLGAWGAGIFSVMIALGGAGTSAAVGMIVVQLLANGALQQLVQPIAYGAALGIHPLAVLLVTIAGGGLFGAAGLILAAPLTAAATRIAADMARDGGEIRSPAAASSSPRSPRA